MKKRTPVLPVIVLLLLGCGILTALHLGTRVSVPETTLSLEYDGERMEVPLDRFTWTEVRATIRNAKGEPLEIRTQGILLSELLAEAELSAFTNVTVAADDEYRAEVSADELAGDVYLLQQEDGGVQLVVLGDADRKRNVSDVVRIIVT